MLTTPADKYFSLCVRERAAWKCEYCGKHVPMRCGCHVFSRGAGRLDHPLNLVALGLNPFTDCPCHQDSHSKGIPSQMDLLTVVAAREGALQDDIHKAIYIVRALPKSATARNVAQMCNAFEANLEVVALVGRILKESKDA